MSLSVPTVSRTLFSVLRDRVCVACTPRLQPRQHILFHAQRRLKSSGAGSNRRGGPLFPKPSFDLDIDGQSAAAPPAVPAGTTPDRDGKPSAAIQLTFAETEEARRIKRLNKRLQRLQDGTFKPKSRLRKTTKGEATQPWRSAPGVLEAISERIAMGRDMTRDTSPSSLDTRTRSARRKLKKLKRNAERTGSSEVSHGAAENPSAVQRGLDMRRGASSPSSDGASRASQQSRKKIIGATWQNADRKTSDQVRSAAPRKLSVQPRSAAPRPELEGWKIQKAALERKFGEEGWKPSKRLSPDTLPAIRALVASNPQLYTTELIAKEFGITPEAIRRILKSKWQPTEEETAGRHQRWENRGFRKWQNMAEEGMRPPGKWRGMGVTPVARDAKGKPLWVKRRAEGSESPKAS